ncbi:MAG: EAL domain-containing protein [Peptococcaceae bacterium]|nr:EAL domain-containing protein [Peptococcaceae bacterium]
MNLTRHTQQNLVRAIKNGYPVWIIYMDVQMFQEIEFRQGMEACNRILVEVEAAIKATLKEQKKLFHMTLVENRGGDDFVVYLVPSAHTPWEIHEAQANWVKPLERRINNRIKGEHLTLRAGIALCKSENGRSPESVLKSALKETFLLNKSEPDPNYFVRRETVNSIIQQPEQYLRIAYQPIWQVQTNRIFGFEALSRVHQLNAFQHIGDLFPFAEKIGQLYPVETTCRRAAIIAAKQVLQPKEALFLNINPHVLTDPAFASGETRKLLLEHSLQPSDVVLEITEGSAIEDFTVFRQALNHYRNQGYRIALDDVGAGYSSLQSIAELHPDFLKIDRSLIASVNCDPIKWALLETFVTFSKRIGCQVLAEGVETIEELQTVVQLGVDYVQGYFLARPEFTRAKINQVAIDLIETDNKQKDLLDAAILSLVEPLSLFEAEEQVGTIEKFFRARANEWLIGIVKTGQIVGTVQRDKLFAMLGTRYGVSLYERRSIASIMDPNPLIVEDSTPVEVVSSLAMSRPASNLYEGVIVVNHHKPVGMVSIAALLKAMAERQIQIARGASPLTGLPGNLQIDREIRRRLDSDSDFSVIYADLNRFKHYNDVHGFEQGDRAIKLLGNVLTQEAANCDHLTFVGHIGGDDFILITGITSLESCCTRILHSFTQERCSLLGAATLTVALAGFKVLASNQETTITISEKVAQLKKEVKACGDNAYLIK